VTVTQFIFEASKEKNKYEVVKLGQEGFCDICGAQISSGAETDRVLSSAFNNRDDVATNSGYLCEACANIMRGELSTTLRRYSFVAEPGRLTLFKLQELAEVLFKRKFETPFVICHTSSHKKHNAYRAFISNSNHDFKIRWEDKVVHFERAKARKMFKALVELYYGVFTKQMLSEHNFPFGLIRKFGEERFFELEASLEPHFGSTLYQLLIEALPSGPRMVYQDFKKQLEKTKQEVEKHESARKRRKGGQAALFHVEEH